MTTINVPFYKKKSLYLGAIRYLLGLIMVAYGLTKILRTQIVLIPFSTWQRPMEYVTGKSIAWAFLGYSQWFQVLMGFLEFIPGLLLLFRRTTLAGAILLLPVTLNVYLINQALNLWADTKVLSLILVLMNVAIILFDWGRMKTLLNIILTLGQKFKSAVWEVVINVVLVGAVFCLSIPYLMEYVHQSDVLTGDWYHGHPNEWVLQTERVGNRVHAPEQLRWYFGAFGKFSALHDTSFMKQNFYEYALDEKNHILNFYPAKNKTVKWHYHIVGDTMLYLQRPSDSLKTDTVNQIFKRRAMITSR